MPIADDGDLVRGLGFVTLYSAYLEEAIDECVAVLLAADPDPDERIHRQPTSEKIRYCKGQLRSLAPLPAELTQLPAVLDHARELFERRHDVVHGRIYAVPSAGDVRKSGRRGVPDRSVTSAELYALANEIDVVPNHLMHASMFALPRLIETRRANPPPTQQA